jgi:tricorn protease
MKKICFIPVLLLLFLIPSFSQEHLMRFGDVRGDKVLFTYEGDLWTASISGGTAARLTSDKGAEMCGKFSPDGKWIAFTGEYDGGLDVYVMPSQGGEPVRLTYHPSTDLVLGWSPDGKDILFRSRREYPARGEQIYVVAAQGGTERKLPVDRGGLASFSPDGKSLAYCRITGESATWKRHQGGDAQEIWMGSLETHDYKVIAPWRGIDNYPMWWGNAIYFNSDRFDGTLNIVKFDTKTGDVKRITNYKDYDIKYPSLGDGRIIFQYGEKLNVLDLATEKVTPLNIRIPSDRVHVRADYVDPGDYSKTFGLSPDGKFLLLESRGEILVIPAEKEKGLALNLTQTSGVREKDPAFSPDGKWVAFISDKTGEEEIYVVDSKGEKEPRQLTNGNKGYRINLVWSPDSKYILFHDKFMRLNCVDVAAGKLETIDKGDYDDGWERWGIQDYTFSPDSKWIAYTKKMANTYEIIYLYSMAEKRSYPMTTDLYENFSPSFDPKGKYLYFLSNRDFTPTMGVVDQEHIFLNTTRPYMVLLSAGELNPFTLKLDEKEEKKADPKDKEKTKIEPKAELTKIDPVGLIERTIALEGVGAGSYFRLEATEDGCLFLSQDKPGFENCYTVVTDTTDGGYKLVAYSLKDKKTNEGISGINNYHLSFDKKKLVYKAGNKFGVIDSAGKGNAGDGDVDLAQAKFKIDFVEEFTQIFNEAWRVERDWFYDVNLHQVDWAGVRNHYLPFVPECGTRNDLNYLIGEMIGELNTGHTYVWGGDIKDDAKKVSVTLLGCDLNFSENYPRIVRILNPAEADPELRSALTLTPAKAGDYIIAVDSKEAAASSNFYSLFENKTSWIELTLNDKPQKEGARKFFVKPIRSEMGLRYRVWVDDNRQKVAKLSGGKIGYIHIPDMGESGLTEFARTYYGQLDKPAIIIDDRYNAGGFTGDMLISRLARKTWAVTQPREGKPCTNPEMGLYSHVALMINEDTGSCGEFFAEAFKFRQFGKIFGMRTWGGAEGIEAHQGLVDNGTVTPPQFGLYSLDRKWLIEGRGTDPDVEVQNMPKDVIDGKDVQLQTVIDYLMNEVAKDPKEIPPTPPYPNKARPRGSDISYH